MSLDVKYWKLKQLLVIGCRYSAVLLISIFRLTFLPQYFVCSTTMFMIINTWFVRHYWISLLHHSIANMSIHNEISYPLYSWHCHFHWISFNYWNHFIHHLFFHVKRVYDIYFTVILSTRTDADFLHINRVEIINPR